MVSISILTPGGPTYFGVPVLLSCVSLIAQSDDFTLLQLHVMWNITFNEDGVVTTVSLSPTFFTGTPGSSVFANLTYTFLSEGTHTVSCSSTISVTNGSTDTGSTETASTLLHVIGEL